MRRSLDGGCCAEVYAELVVGEDDGTGEESAGTGESATFEDSRLEV